MRLFLVFIGALLTAGAAPVASDGQIRSPLALLELIPEPPATVTDAEERATVPYDPRAPGLGAAVYSDAPNYRDEKALAVGLELKTWRAKLAAAGPSGQSGQPAQAGSAALAPGAGKTGRMSAPRALVAELMAAATKLESAGNAAWDKVSKEMAARGQELSDAVTKLDYEYRDEIDADCHRDAEDETGAVENQAVCQRTTNEKGGKVAHVQVIYLHQVDPRIAEFRAAIKALLGESAEAVAKARAGASSRMPPDPASQQAIDAVGTKELELLQRLVDANDLAIRSVVRDRRRSAAEKRKWIQYQ